jgi:hypothetical protein
MAGKGWKAHVNKRLKQINVYQTAWALAAADELKRHSLAFRLYDYFVIRKRWSWMRFMFRNISKITVVTDRKLDLWKDHPVGMAIIGKDGKVIMTNRGKR